MESKYTLMPVLALSSSLLNSFDVITYYPDTGLISYLENHLPITSVEERDSCRKILEKIGLSGYQVELDLSSEFLLRVDPVKLKSLDLLCKLN